ncbi:hypothetical protein CPB83DRAFT_778848, partial [Crepidotus variabilis]
NQAIQTQQQYMEEWKMHCRETWGRQILAAKAGPANSDRCNHCQIGLPAWRCEECLGQQVTCRLCCRTLHQNLPFHRVERWNGKFFEKAALWQTGLKLYGGHAGRKCPESQNVAEQRNPANSERSMDQTDVASDEIPLDNDNLDGAIWEDIEQDELEGLEKNNDKPLPGTHWRIDNDGNSFLRVVHTNGFHHIPFVPCQCSTQQQPKDLQLLDLQLYPCSSSNIRTAFTFQVLDDVRSCNLDLHASYYQCSLRLRRMTSAVFPSFMPNLVAELRRASRQWRNLKLRKWFGKTGKADLLRGELALFCASCPQIGVNLPDGWQEEIKHKPDGNMTADHVRQKSDGKDVWLTNGEGFMTNKDEYHSHLSAALEIKQVTTCHRYRAMEHSSSSRTGLDVTGLGTHACARHGCFAPGSAVDFQKGERQMNIDWSLCQALQTTGMDQLPEVLHIYDINCQYHIHLQSRIENNPYLNLDTKVELIKAIGLFHVHAHQESCLYQYATSYVPGAGVVDGEILETLWALLNLISRSGRTASLAHRTELLDDHMGDSNHKKLVHIVQTTIKKYVRAQEGILVSQTYLSDMTDIVVEQELPLNEWTTEIEEAESKRQQDVETMNCMMPKIAKAASLKEVQASLLWKDFHNVEIAGDDDGATDWLVDGIQIEGTQIELQQHVRRLGFKPTKEKKVALEQRRKRLLNRIKNFHSTSSRFLTVQLVQEHSQRAVIVSEQDGNISDQELPDAPAPVPSDVENSQLVFPSMLVGPQSAGVASLQAREAHLREARANEALEGVRETISLLSFQYASRKKKSTSKTQITKSWDEIKQISQSLSYHRRVYNHNHWALKKIKPAAAQKFPFLSKDDCNMSTAITELNAPGQSKAQLAWFWTEAQNLGSDESPIAVRSGLVGRDRIQECKFLLVDRRTVHQLAQFIDFTG